MILFFNPGHLQNSRNPTLDKLGPSLIITGLVKNLKFCQPKDTPKEEYNKETHEYRNWTEERKEKYCNDFLAVLNRQSALKSRKNKEKSAIWVNSPDIFFSKKKKPNMLTLP